MRFWRPDPLGWLDIGTIYGRWSDIGQSNDSVPIPQIDVPSNDAFRTLDVLVKFDDEPQCHAIDDQSRNSDWKKYPLGFGLVCVEVALKSERATATSWFEITHSGTQGGKVELTPTPLRPPG